jgi:hypothetical protein
MRKTYEFAVKVITDPEEALRRVVYDSHALEACAQAIGVSHQTLSKKFNPEELAELSLRQAAAIEQFMKTDALADCFAARAGGVFLKTPTVEDKDPNANVVADYGKVVKEFAEANSAFAEMLADNTIGADEVDKLEKEMRDVFVRGLLLVRHARGRVGKGGT